MLLLVDDAYREVEGNGKVFMLVEDSGEPSLGVGLEVGVC